MQIGSTDTTTPEVTKRKVTMRSVRLVDLADGTTMTVEEKAEDYVRPDILDAYVTDAKTRWQSVTVSSTPDAGPGGWGGQTVVPVELDHVLAGSVFAAVDVKG